MIFSSAAEHGAKCGTIYNAQSLGKSLNQADFWKETLQIPRRRFSFRASGA